MTTSEPALISSRDNALLKDLRRLAQDSTEYRKQGRIWLEGDHMCRAALERGVKPAVGVFSEGFWPAARVEWAQAALKNVAVLDPLFTGLRLSRGVKLDVLSLRYNVDVWERFQERLAPFVDAGILLRQETGLRLTRSGMLLANEVMSVFV